MRTLKKGNGAFDSTIKWLFGLWLVFNLVMCVLGIWGYVSTDGIIDWVVKQFASFGILMPRLAVVGIDVFVFIILLHFIIKGESDSDKRNER